MVIAIGVYLFGGAIFRPHMVLGASSNGRIAFTGQDGLFTYQIYTMNADGSDVQQLTNDSTSHLLPVWSPDGTKIAFMGEDFGDQTAQIFVMNADGSGLTDITNDDNTQNGTPAWSPDGSKIAYASSDASYSTPTTINVMNADGSGKATLTDGSSQDAFPAWSPDGNTLAFICADGQNVEQICTMDADGSNQQQITSGTAIDYTSVAYSPSGTEFVYSTYDTSNNDIINIDELGTMNTDGSNSQIIDTADHTAVADASWSPDGTKLIYDSFDSSESIQRVYSISPDGSNETALSPDNQYSITPAWQPVPGSDIDGDGILNNTEAAGPNSGDANGDGIADKFQSRVTSIVDPVSGAYVSVQSTCSANSAVTAQALPASYGDPAFHYPAGLIGFTLDCSAAGSTATVTEYFYGVPAQNTMVLRKYDVTSHSYSTIPGSTVTAVTIGGQAVTKITYHITDGGPFDQDGSANGTIVDPVGLAVPSVGTPNTGVGGLVSMPWRLDAPSL